MDYSFRFVDRELNNRLIALLEKAKIAHRLDGDGTIHYSSAAEEVVGNEILTSMRNKLFSRWQIISCPATWAARYRRYMMRHGIKFVEELIDHQLCFLVARDHRPHSWRLEESEDHPVRKMANGTLIKKLCEVLIENRRARTLGQEILRDLPTGYLGDETYKRLSRWCNPERSEPQAQPIARRLSQELFGHVIARAS